MSFGTFAAIVALMLIFWFIISSVKGSNMCFDDEETATTTTTEAQINIVGNLKRETEGVQSFVIDPVDQQKIWLNSNDDMYEDANGKIWRLA